jgi:hypothetical protein
VTNSRSSRLLSPDSSTSSSSSSSSSLSSSPRTYSDGRQRTISQYSSSSSVNTHSNNPSFLLWRPTIRSSRHSSTSSISSLSSTTDSENNDNNTNQISQRRVVPKLTIRMRPDPILLDELGKTNSSKSSHVAIKLDNGKRSLIDTSTSSSRSSKRRKT